MAQRKSLSKKLRFEVFKRDSFTCQYCGRMAPDVVLQVDHINPIKNGGDNDILNLITSCFDCNSGKGARKLTDKQEIQKQQEQLKLLSQKKEQLEFMVKWREGLLSLSEAEVDVAEKEIQKFNSKHTLSEVGRQNMRKLINRFTLTCVLDAIPTAYTVYDKAGTSESWNAAFNKIGGICRNRQIESEDPTFQYRQRAYFFFKKNYNIYNEGRIRGEIKRLVKDEETLSTFYNIVDESRTWSNFFEIAALYGDE